MVFDAGWEGEAVEKKYPELYYQFFEQFNQGEYYACHDLLEELWMEDRTNTFLKGLLQMSVAIYHYQNGNCVGARRLFHSARNYLTPYLPRFWDVDVALVVSYIDACLTRVPPEDKIPPEVVRQRPLPKLVLHVEESPDSPKSFIQW